MGPEMDFDLINLVLRALIHSIDGEWGCCRWVSASAVKKVAAAGFFG